MSDWSFLGVFASGAATCFVLLRGAKTIKDLWPSRAKPQLLEARNCCIFVAANEEYAEFDLLVNNAGSKDCSVLSVELRWPDGVSKDFEYKPRLPITISPGRTERITVEGYALTKESFKFRSRPKQRSVEATVVVKFNTDKDKKKKISFINRTK